MGLLKSPIWILTPGYSPETFNNGRVLSNDCCSAQHIWVIKNEKAQMNML